MLLDYDIGMDRGMDSLDDPEMLPRGYYVRSMNSINRGGRVRCRPGYRTVQNLPDGNLQGARLFSPGNSAPVQAIVIVDGKVYYAVFPFTHFRLIEGIELNPYSDQVYFQEVVQSVTRNRDGSITLIDPEAVLIMRDGASAPIWWNGSVAGTERRSEDPFTIPVGTAMAWSGDRLWVARGNRVEASDLGNPFSFREQTEVSGSGPFFLNEDVTAMVEMPALTNSPVLVFTQNTTTSFSAFIRQRELWFATQDFMLPIQKRIGCTSQRSVIAHNSLLWWMSAQGYTRLDYALATRHTSGVAYLDAAMTVSRAYLGELSKVAAGSFENFLLISVPYADRQNQHTWVADTVTTAGGAGGGAVPWVSYWTGTRPVEWLPATLFGKSKLYFISKDHDGHNRLWEAFQEKPLDNGCPVTMTLETRGYVGGPEAMQNFKRFRYVDVYFVGIEGVVDVAIEWSGTFRGKWKRICTRRLRALKGTVSGTMRFDKKDFMLKPQMRRVRSEDVVSRTLDNFSTCGVEFERREASDYGFQVCIRLNGTGAIRRIQVHVDEDDVTQQGECKPDEADNSARATRFDGAATIEDTPLEAEEVLATVPGAASAHSSQFVDVNGVVYSATASVQSSISALCAQKQADCAAQFKAQFKAEQDSVPFVGGFLVPC